MKRLPMLLLAVMATACGGFRDEEARFLASNRGPDPVTFLINGRQMEVAPGATQRFTTIIPVPKNPYGVTGGPSAVDKVVGVTAEARNDRTGFKSVPRTCDAGVKIVTTVAWDGRSSFIDCLYSY